MMYNCIWEHNGSDTLLYVAELPGAFSRGKDLDEALSKIPHEIISYLRWSGSKLPSEISVNISEDCPCTLNVKDADSDVIFESERSPLTAEEYEKLKALCLKSAADFLSLYNSIPDKHKTVSPERKTFYGSVPRSAEEMYLHTKKVNEYYFGEIGVPADNGGDIYECRKKGFDTLEKIPDFLNISVIEGSYGELWSLRKVLRRFIWHDRIHAKAMYRMAKKAFKDNIPDPFYFEL